jgi:molybdopterin-guanine dinucleotide biosynthesis protein A
VADPGLTGILLVGGASTRFGSSKALARLGGATLAELAWETLAFCDERIAVGKAADALVLPFPVLDDGEEVRAPIVGVVAGLRAASNDLCLVLPVDTPRIDEAVLLALARACTGDVAVPVTGPLPGAYRASALPALQRALSAGRLSLKGALAGLDVASVEIEPAILLNVNTPDDLRLARV